MPSLAEVQAYFREAVVQGDVRRVAPVLAGGHDPAKRLVVHQRNYETSLVEALLVKFPATGWLIGTPFLREAARRFVHEYPPQAPCIAEYGATFPGFLAQTAGVRWLPYIRDFAELEWHVGQVAIATDFYSVPAEEFSDIDVAALPDTTLTLQPGLRYIESEWPVDDLLKLYLTETAPDQFGLTTAGVWIEVRGARGEFHLSRLDRGEFTFRKCISEGLSIGDAAEHALDINPSFDPGQALAGLIAAALVTAIHREDSREND